MLLWPQPAESNERAAAAAQAKAVGRATARHIIRRRMRRLPQVAAMGACLVAGCGGSGGTPAKQRTITVPASRGVTVTGREYSFDPSKLVVTHGGGKLRLTLRNKGSLPHDVHAKLGMRASLTVER